MNDYYSRLRHTHMEKFPQFRQTNFSFLEIHIQFLNRTKLPSVRKINTETFDFNILSTYFGR